jgi:hypothetical protein
MKKILLILSLVFLFSCDKDNNPDDPSVLVIQAMTNGQWKVSNYTKAGADKTPDFAPYKFQFKTNFTVDAINNGTTEKSGTWMADANAKTITSNFTNASATVSLLNGTWDIVKTSWTSVDAKQTVNGEECILRLDKL